MQDTNPPRRPIKRNNRGKNVDQTGSEKKGREGGGGEEEEEVEIQEEDLSGPEGDAGVASNIYGNRDGTESELEKQRS